MKTVRIAERQAQPDRGLPRGSHERWDGRRLGRVESCVFTQPGSENTVVSCVLRRLKTHCRQGFPFVCGAVLYASMASFLPAAEWLLSGDLSAHDPSILKEEDSYPNGNWWWSPATGPGLAMKFSSDGVNWRQGLQFFNAENKPAWWADYSPAMKPLGIWSPDIIKFRDRYWCFYSISEFGKNNSAIGLTSATGIFRGDWREDGVVVSSRQGVDTFNAVDPGVVVDAEGNPWLVFGSFNDGHHLIQLDPETMKPLAGAPLTSILRRRSDLGIDNPYIVYTNGYYYLFTAVDLCCNGKSSTQKIAYARSRQITGPYTGKEDDPDNSVSDMMIGSLTILEKGDARWAGVGGPNIYRHGDGWIIIRHGYDKNAGGAQKMRINDLYWDAAGWPTYTPPDLADQSGVSGQSIVFNAPSSIRYQWQVSTNDGETWSNLTDDGTYLGATAASLTVKATTAMNGYRYRVSTGNGGATSNVFTLRVTVE